MVGYGHTETGQTGDGGIGTLRYLANNSGTYAEYDYASLLEDPGQPATSAAIRAMFQPWFVAGATRLSSSAPSAPPR